MTTNTNWIQDPNGSAFALDIDNLEVLQRMPDGDEIPWYSDAKTVETLRDFHGYIDDLCNQGTMARETATALQELIPQPPEGLPTDIEMYWTPDCQITHYTPEGGQGRTIARWENGRGAICLGADSIWGDWIGRTFFPDDDCDGGAYDENGDFLDPEKHAASKEG